MESVLRLRPSWFPQAASTWNWLMHMFHPDVADFVNWAVSHSSRQLGRWCGFHQSCATSTLNSRSRVQIIKSFYRDCRQTINPKFDIAHQKSIKAQSNLTGFCCWWQPRLFKGTWTTNSDWRHFFPFSCLLGTSISPGKSTGDNPKKTLKGGRGRKAGVGPRIRETSQLPGRCLARTNRRPIRWVFPNPWPGNRRFEISSSFSGMQMISL